MTVLFDTNVLLDVLLDRTHAPVASYVLDQSRSGTCTGVVTPTVITNTYYVGKKTKNDSVARAFLQSALSFLDVASVSHAGALRSTRQYADVEDGIVGEAAAEYGTDVICTRNTDDFGPARPSVLTPAELARLLQE